MNTEQQVQEKAMSISPWILRDICNNETAKGIERKEYSIQDVIEVSQMMLDSSRYIGYGKRMIRNYGDNR